MMCNSQLISKWLKIRLTNINNISLSLIFGSVAQNKQNPTDCDLLVITNTFAGSDYWYSLRRSLKSLSIEFETEFKLKLSVTLMTIDEFDEDNSLNNNIKNNFTFILTGEQ